MSDAERDESHALPGVIAAGYLHVNLTSLLTATGQSRARERTKLSRPSCGFVLHMLSGARNFTLAVKSPFGDWGSWTARFAALIVSVARPH
jgi:hypothetical protein